MNDAWSAASQDMYKAQQEQQNNAGGAQNNSGAQNNDQKGNGENVTDVDFEEVK